MATSMTLHENGLPDYSNQQMALIRKTVAADCNAGEFDLYMEVARRMALDPFRRQIYAVVYNKDKPNKRKMAIITGIDGFRAVAQRSGSYRPDENEADITYDEKLKGDGNPLGIVKALVKVERMAADGSWKFAAGVAYWDEFAPMKEDGEWIEGTDKWPDGNPKKKFVGNGEFTLDATSNWKKMPRVMISKCAEAQALRRGWPEDLSGIYAPEEMDHQMVDITPSEAVEAAETEDRMLRIGGKNNIAMLFEAGEGLVHVELGKMADRCMEFLTKSESATEVEWWTNTNRVSLQEFWALSPSDALEVKTLAEKRLQELSTPAEPEQPETA